MKTIAGMLEVSTEFAQNITFNQERIQKALPAGHLDATTLADYLVKKASATKHSSVNFQSICLDRFWMFLTESQGICMENCDIFLFVIV